MQSRAERSSSRRKLKKGSVSAAAARDTVRDADPVGHTGEAKSDETSHKENIGSQLGNVSSPPVAGTYQGSSAIASVRAVRDPEKRNSKKLQTDRQQSEGQRVVVEEHTECQQRKGKGMVSRKATDNVGGKRAREEDTDRRPTPKAKEAKDDRTGTDNESDSFPDGDEETRFERRHQPWRFSRAGRYAALLEEAKRQKKNPRRHGGPSHTHACTGGFYDNDMWESSEDDEDWSPEKIYGKDESRRLLNSRYSESSSPDTDDESGEEREPGGGSDADKQPPAAAASDHKTSRTSSVVLDTSTDETRLPKNSDCSKMSKQRKKPSRKEKKDR